MKSLCDEFGYGGCLKPTVRKMRNPKTYLQNSTLLTLRLVCQRVQSWVFASLCCGKVAERRFESVADTRFPRHLPHGGRWALRLFNWASQDQLIQLHRR